MSERDNHILNFLETAGWGRAARVPVPGDASTRRYERLTLGGDKAVLMDAPDTSETKPGSYPEIAKLADGSPLAFAAIAEALTQRGFSAPKILAADLNAGLILLEDLGDSLVARVIETAPEKETEIYEAAIDTLAAIYRSTFSKTLSYRRQDWTVRNYDTAAMLAEVDLFLEWYVADSDVKLPASAMDDFHTIWRDLFLHLDSQAPGLALRDFHAENIFWLPQRAGTATIGLIDFQDGLMAHPAYDLVSLLEDARRDVPRALHAPLIQQFCDKAGILDKTAFETAYAVLGAQRNAKILGIFVRLAKRDGKPAYRELLPRVEALFRRNIAAPALKPLKDWCEAHVPALVQAPRITTAMVLAAGHGTRMRPLTNDRSKAMVEVGGKPLIDHMLDRLTEVGIKRAVVNVHAHADHLEAHLRSRKDSPEIIISNEREQLLETGGGVVKALPLLGDAPVLICNIDAIWTEKKNALAAMIAMWDEGEMDDLLLLAKPDALLGYYRDGDFDLGIDDRLTRRDKASASPNRKSGVYAGVQIARLDPIRGFPLEPFSRNKVWDVSLKKRRVFGIMLDGFWMHVGDPDAREQAEARLSGDD